MEVEVVDHVAQLPREIEEVGLGILPLGIDATTIGGSRETVRDETTECRFRSGKASRCMSRIG